MAITRAAASRSASGSRSSSGAAGSTVDSGIACSAAYREKSIAPPYLWKVPSAVASRSWPSTVRAPRPPGAATRIRGSGSAGGADGDGRHRPGSAVSGGVLADDAGDAGAVGGDGRGTVDHLVVGGEVAGRPAGAQHPLAGWADRRPDLG